MYYQLNEFYKRDIYLQYAEENSIQYNAFEKGERIEIKSDIFYKVDKIDDYWITMMSCQHMGHR